MEVLELPQKVTHILSLKEAPLRLVKHLRLVYTTAKVLVDALESQWPNMNLNNQLICTGAAIHDIGKVLKPSEIYDKGKEHERLGESLLLEYGFDAEVARFAQTHGNWNTDKVILEDLLVTLADKIWKGNRIIALEEKVGHSIAQQLKVDYWDVYTALDKIIERIALSADERLLWQGD